jgi:hypothetical protein
MLDSDFFPPPISDLLESPPAVAFFVWLAHAMYPGVIWWQQNMM